MYRRSGLDFEAAGGSARCMLFVHRVRDVSVPFKSAHPSLWQTCKVLRPWALFRARLDIAVQYYSTTGLASSEHSESLAAILCFYPVLQTRSYNSVVCVLSIFSLYSERSM